MSVVDTPLVQFSKLASNSPSPGPKEDTAELAMESDLSATPNNAETESTTISIAGQTNNVIEKLQIPNNTPTNNDLNDEENENFNTSNKGNISPYTPRKKSKKDNHSHYFTQEKIEKLKTFESQNYFPANCEAFKYYVHYHDIEHKKSISKWLLMGLIGFTVGVIGYLLKSVIHYIFEQKLYFVNSFIHKSEFALSFLYFSSIGLFLIILSAAMVVYISPYAASSGVPEVMGYLNGVYLPQYFSIRVLIVKFLSCCLCVSSSIPVGPEGPMISMGAIVGFITSQTFKMFNNSADCRDLVSAGCASGVSSAFAAPIGGLLFAMEEVSSFWSTKIGMQIFFASMIAVFITSLFMSAYGSFHKYLTFGLFSPHAVSIFDTEWPITVNMLIFVHCLLIGVIGGLLGALFTWMNLKINAFRLNFNQITDDKTKCKLKSGCLCIAELCVCVLLWSLITIYVPMLFECKYVDKKLHDSFDKKLLHLNAYNCVNKRDENEWIVYNDAASLLLVTPEYAINNLLRRQIPNLFGYPCLILICFLYFVFGAYLAGTVISCGFVIPMIFIGAMYGRIIGEMSNDLFPKSNDGKYWEFLDAGVMALLGSASFYGGVSRLTIALTVILMEMTDDTVLLLPIMATVMCSKQIGDYLTHSLYHGMLQLKALPFLDSDLSSIHNLELFSVKYILNKQADEVIKLTEIIKIRDLISAMNRGKHGAYPVVDCDGRFVGNILSRHIHYIFLKNKANRKGVFCQSRFDAQTKSKQSKNKFLADWKPDISFQAMDMLDVGDRSTQTIKIHKSNEGYLDYWMSLTEYVDSSPFIVYEHTSLSRAYILFRTMGLRHLTVINKDNGIAGIITRFDLLGINIEKSVEEYIENHENERDHINTRDTTHRFNTVRSLRVKKGLFKGQKSFIYFD